MKKIMLILMLFSIVYAETPREHGYRVISNANKVYKMDFKKEACIDVTKYKNGESKIWKNGGMLLPKVGLVQYGFIALDLGSYQDGNGRFIYVTEQPYPPNKILVNLYMVNNQEFCQKIVKNKNTVEGIKSIAQKDVSTMGLGYKAVFSLK